MKTYRSTLRTMRLVLLVCQLGLILRTDAQIPNECITSDTNRPPENADITVTCGTERMYLSIYLCPMYQALYNESLMVLNNSVNNPDCYGTADWSNNPPVLKFSFSINDSSLAACNLNRVITSEVGSGEFSEFSNVQFINVSGVVTSIDPVMGTVTYRRQILYKFSCKYPMQYLLNNTEVAVSGVSIAIKDNNASLISTLSMRLYQDENYINPLPIPESGLDLKTKIYVEVKATNLTERFNVLLDRCYATVNPYPSNSPSYDLFVGCTRDPQTRVVLNGDSQRAQFYFEAFRFVLHKNRTISTFYLHCATRLCEVSQCSSLKPNCESFRRRRDVNDAVQSNATVTSRLIRVGTQSLEEVQTSVPSKGTPPENYSGPVVAVIICIVIIAIFLAAFTVYFGLYIRRTKPIIP